MASDPPLRAGKQAVPEAVERDWATNGRAKVWVWKDGAYAPTTIADRKDDGTVKVAFENGETATVGEEEAERMNHPRLATVENLTDLDAVNAASSIHVLQQRYAAGLIHTYAGNALIIVNPHKDLPIYGDSVLPLFRASADAMPPHIFAVAENAYREAVTEMSRRVVLFSGEAGSGKSHALSQAVRYIARMAVGSAKGKKGAKAEVSGDRSGMVRALLSTAVEPLFHAFASARTPRSAHSSRAGRLVTLEFDGIGALAGAGIQCFSFERSRLTHAAPGERTFNALYQLVRAAEKGEACIPADAGVESASQSCRYLMGTQGDAADAVGWKETDAALAVLGVAEEARKALWSVLAAIVHLGCLVPRQGSASAFESDAPLQAAARVLGVPATDLSSALLTQAPKGASRNALSAAVDGLARGLYERVVLYVLAQLNAALQSRGTPRSSVSLVDHPGFDVRSDKGASPDAHGRLCANALAERLRSIHHAKTLVDPQAEYAAAGISWAEIDFGPSASGAAADAIFGAVFPALEEESQAQGEGTGSADDVLGRLARAIPATSAASVGAAGVSLTVTHSACSVEYGVDASVLDCDRGFLSPQVQQVLSLSGKALVAEIFQTAPQASLSFRRAGSAGAASSLPAMRSGGTRNRSLAMQLRESVEALAAFLGDIRPSMFSFVHCLSPNASGRGGGFDHATVRRCLKQDNILEAVRMHRQGYPSSAAFKDFAQRYRFLEPSLFSGDDAAFAKALLASPTADAEPSSYRFGEKAVFMRASCVSALERARDTRLAAFVVPLQARCRGYLGRKAFATLQERQLAASVIQRNVRIFVEVRQWPWWKLYNKIQSRKQIEGGDDAGAKAGAKGGLSDKERKALEERERALAAKNAELVAALNKERAAAAEALDRLDREASDRRLAERALNDIKGELSLAEATVDKLTSTNRRLTLDVERLTAELEEGSAEADVAMRQKMARVQKELDELKAKYQSESEEFARVSEAKRLAERQLSEARDEAESAKTAAAELKRRLAKAQTEADDLALRVEKEEARVAELEKKQRKFDNQLAEVSDRGSDERGLREALTREKDRLARQLEDLNAENEKLRADLSKEQSERRRLESELEDAVSGGGVDEKALNDLKRAKRDLERQVGDLEEEVEELQSDLSTAQQAKQRVELALAQERKQFAADMEAKDEEFEESKHAMTRRLRALEEQVEEIEAEKNVATKLQRDAEKALSEAKNNLKERDATITKLKVALKKARIASGDTGALSRSASLAAGGGAGGSAPDAAAVKSLRAQVEDLEAALATAQKARTTAERECEDLREALSDAARAKSDADTKMNSLSKQLGELRAKMEEDDEEFAELVKRQSNNARQLTRTQEELAASKEQLDELEEKNSELQKKVNDLTRKLEDAESEGVPKSQADRLDRRVKELEEKIVWEQAERRRIEGKMERLEEAVEAAKGDTEREAKQTKALQEQLRAANRRAADLKDEIAALEAKLAVEQRQKNEAIAESEEVSGREERLKKELADARRRISQISKMDSDDDVLDATDEDALSDDVPTVSSRPRSRGSISRGSFSQSYTRTSTAARKTSIGGDDDDSPYEPSDEDKPATRRTTSLTKTKTVDSDEDKKTSTFKSKYADSDEDKKTSTFKSKYADSDEDKKTSTFKSKYADSDEDKKTSTFKSKHDSDSDDDAMARLTAISSRKPAPPPPVDDDSDSPYEPPPETDEERKERLYK